MLDSLCGVFVSDLHLGAYSFGTIDEHTGLNTRFLDLLNNLDIAIEFAIKKQSSFFVLAGDIYKIKDPNSYVREQFAKRVVKLLLNGISVYIITGNHDQTIGLNKSHALIESQVFTDVLKNLKIFETPQNLVLQSQDRKDTLLLSFLPHVNRAKHDLKDDDAFYDFQIETIKKLSDDANLIEEKVDGNLTKVFVGHFGTDKSVPGGTHDVGISKSPRTIPVDILKRTSFDLTLLGDIHKHQKIEKNIYHIGSIGRVSFNEAEERKGFFFLDVSEDKLEFIELKDREFINLHLDLSTAKMNSVIDEFYDEIKNKDLSNAIVKLKLRVREDDINLVDFDKLKSFVSKSCLFFAGINKDIIRDQQDVDLDIENEDNINDVLKSVEAYLEQVGQLNIINEVKEVITLAEKERVQE